jgi:Rho GTPase-activating protein RGD1
MDGPPSHGPPHGPPQSAGPGMGGGYLPFNGHQQHPQPDRGFGGPPQPYPGPNGPQSQGYPGQQPPFSPNTGPGSRPNTGGGRPRKAVFGVSLDELFMRDQTPVPKVVMDCLQAVEMFGLEIEGIYRVPGTAAHISQLRQLFDNDVDSVDFRNPETFYHDVNSVAGLLKQFFRDLPDPLMTSESYGRFIEAGRIEDPTQRRDAVHAVINELPDANYATLRALVLHLQRVQERSASNRMSSSNLAICFA